MPRVTLSIEYRETPGTVGDSPPISIQLTGTATQVSARNPTPSLVPRTTRLNSGRLNWWLPNPDVSPVTRTQTYRQVDQIRLSPETANAITFFAEIFQTRVTGFSQGANGQFFPIHEVDMRNEPIIIDGPRRLIGGRHYNIIVTNNHGRFSARFTERVNRIDQEAQTILALQLIWLFIARHLVSSRP